MASIASSLNKSSRRMSRASLLRTCGGDLAKAREMQAFLDEEL
jgi:hypothetical protein